MPPLRILHLPDVVGGHPTALSRAEAATGAHSKTLSYLKSPFGYNADIELRYFNAVAPVRWAERIIWFARIRNKYDVFHCNFGSSLLNSAGSILNLADIPYFPENTARLMTYQGSDCRLLLPPEYRESRDMEMRLGSFTSINDPAPSASRIEKMHKVIEKSDKYCHHVFALNPDLLNFLPGNKSTFLPYAIEKPELMISPEKANSWESTRPLHIVHLSTNRALKGTGLIENALREAALTTGITYEIVVRKSRPHALAAMARADLLIDQIILGWYGATAVEAMYNQIPVAAFISPEQSAAAPMRLSNQLPIVNTNSSRLISTIKQLDANREILKNAANAGEAFANEWHHPSVIAKQTLAKYTDVLNRNINP